MNRTAGLFYNPVGLAELMTLATPVALALSLQPGGSRWRRPLALATLVGVALVFVPIEQRSAHLGVAAGVSGFLALAWITAARRTGLGRRRLVALAGVAVVLLVVSLGFGVSADHPMAASPRRHCRRSGFDRVAR